MLFSTTYEDLLAHFPDEGVLRAGPESFNGRVRNQEALRFLKHTGIPAWGFRWARDDNDPVDSEYGSLDLIGGLQHLGIYVHAEDGRVFSVDEFGGPFFLINADLSSFVEVLLCLKKFVYAEDDEPEDDVRDAGLAALRARIEPLDPAPFAEDFYLWFGYFSDVESGIY